MADVRQPCDPLVTGADERVFEQAEQRDDPEPARRRLDEAEEQRSGGVTLSGVPAESSIAIPQRRQCAATRRARARSGVTSAAV